MAHDEDKSNGNSFGPDRVRPDWQQAMLRETQVSFWRLV